jgi:hypothetical protein
MNREQMIHLLIDDDVDRFVNDDAPADWYAHLRRRGWRGYDDWTDAELLEELHAREIIEA